MFSTHKENKWLIDKLKPNESTISSVYNSEDCYLDEDDEFSLKSEATYEGIPEKYEITQTKEILERLCKEKSFILSEKPEIQVMTVTIPTNEEDQSIPNVRDEVDLTGGDGTSGGETSIFPIPECLKIGE